MRSIVILHLIMISWVAGGEEKTYITKKDSVNRDGNHALTVLNDHHLEKYLNDGSLKIYRLPKLSREEESMILNDSKVVEFEALPTSKKEDVATIHYRPSVVTLDEIEVKARVAFPRRQFVRYLQSDLGLNIEIELMTDVSEPPIPSLEVAGKIEKK